MVFHAQSTRMLIIIRANQTREKRGKKKKVRMKERGRDEDKAEEYLAREQLERGGRG